jgi:uncharacterized protein (DUF1499 family)
MTSKIAIGVLAAFVAVLILYVGTLLLLASSSRRMSVDLGVADGRLSACPATPNCVCSDAAPADSHHIAPFHDPTGSRWAGLAEKVGSMAGATLVRSDNRYAYFTFTSRIMRFVDDVEFHYRPETGEIAVRSASRVGRGDMNANRNRVESIRAVL